MGEVAAALGITEVNARVRHYRAKRMLTACWKTFLDRQPHILVTPEALSELTEKLHALPTAPIGRHLEDDLVVCYLNERLPAMEVDQADRHLRSCPSCAVKLEAQLPADVPEERIRVSWEVVEGGLPPDQRDELVRLVGAIRKLPPGQAKACALAHFSGYTVHVVAAVLESIQPVAHAFLCHAQHRLARLIPEKE